MRIAVVVLDHADPPGRLYDWLVEAGADVSVVDATGGIAGQHVPEHDGLVVLGGKMGAGDDADHPFLKDIRTLLREAVRDEVPVLAICLGAQLLAAANGGRVIENPDGPELGANLVAKRSASASDPLFGELPITPDVIQWHYDTVVTLPPGAVQLASSPVSENQAFRLGRLAWGIQWHIETTPEVVTEWARMDSAQLSEDYPGLDLDRLVGRAVDVHEELAETWTPFVRAFVGVVGDPAAVKTARGPRTTTAEPVTDPAAIRAALAQEMGAARVNPLPMPTMRPDDE